MSDQAQSANSIQEVPAEPEEPKENTLKARTSKRVAWLLDECIRIPGTKIRFGLDPLVGLIPGGGETVATIVGATVLGEAGKKGIPFKTLIRMGGNMLLNAAVGTFPFLGDLFSVWFKSNKRNYEMLNEFLESDDGAEARGGWWPIMLVFIILLVVLATHILMWILIFAGVFWLQKEAGIELPKTFDLPFKESLSF